VDRVYRAFDSVVDPATGQAICRSTLTFPDDGCVPANPFGPGSISPAAAAYITEGRTEQDQQVAQHVAEVKAQGLLFDAPAGASTLAVGSAWRQESVDNRPLRFPSSLDGLTVRPAELDGYRGLPAAYLGLPNIFERTAYSLVHGSYSVWELFAENDLPLVRGGPGLRRIDLNSAMRYAWYSGSGGVLAWKGGIDWRLSRELRLRATRSRDIRAGSLSERFDSSGVGGVVNDPFRAGNPSTPIIGVRSGSPAIDPEKADTLTFGGVYQPAFVPGLSMSADYYDIRIGDAIASLGVQAIVDRCFEGDARFCPQILRDAGSGLIVAVNNSFQNIAEARSRGIDAELSLRRRISLFGGAEGIALRVFANRTLESSTTNIGQATVDRVGQTGLPGGAPRWQANLTFAYERGPLQLTLQERIISRGTYSATYGPGAIDDNRVGGAAYTNLRASWRFGEDPQSLLLFFNVNNLFDRDPPLAADWGFVGSIPTNEGLFDVIGRRYTIGVRLRR
jgi:outer membrane receptor protein involved in Fe transport